MSNNTTPLVESPRFVVFSGGEHLDLGPKRAAAICESEAQARPMITFWPGTGYYEPRPSNPQPETIPDAPCQCTIQHFNRLTEAENENLALLMEECSEVIRAASKILRHGYDGNKHGRLPHSNPQALERELGHVHHAVHRLQLAGDVGPRNVDSHSKVKALYITPYLHDQQPPATRG